MILNILHSLVNIFAGGRSSAKLIIFLIYLPLLVIIYIILKKRPIKSYPWKYFGWGLGAMYLYGFCLQIAYVIQNHLPFFSFFVTGDSLGISCSSFNHTHIAKAVIGLIYSYFNRGRSTTVDVGGAYLSFFPNSVFFIGTILLVVLLITSIVYFITSFRSIMSEKNLRQQAFMITGYAITSFSLIKSSIDGGFLCANFLVISLFIWLFIIKEKNGGISGKVYFNLAIIGVIVSVIGWTTNFLIFYYFSSSALCQIGAMIMLYTALLYGTEQKTNKIVIILLILSIIACYWPVLENDFKFYDKYGKAILMPGTYFYTYDYNLLKIDRETINKEIDIAQLISNLRKNIYYKPISVPGITCQKGQKSSLRVTMISREYPDNISTSSPLLSIVSWPPLEKNGIWSTSLLIILDSCLPDPTAAIDGSLRNNGISNYILVLNNNSFNGQK